VLGTDPGDGVCEFFRFSVGEGLVEDDTLILEMPQAAKKLAARIITPADDLPSSSSWISVSQPRVIVDDD
jgi:hypothetical protein